MKNALFTFAALIALLSAACSGSHSGSADESQSLESGLLPENFDTVIGGKKVHLITLRNDSMEVSLTNYGARVVSLMVRDREGNFRDMLLGFDSIASYISDSEQIGAITGRYGGYLSSREIKGRNTNLRLSENHSNWADSVFDIESQSENSVTFIMAADDKTAGFPGVAGVKVDFTLNNSTLTIAYTAVTDNPTVFDIAHRLQFNLNGVTDSVLTTVGDHQMSTNSEQHLRLDSLLHPTGDVLMSIWTPLDFREPKSLKHLMNGDMDEVRWAKGVNTAFVFSLDSNVPGFVRLYSPQSGIVLNVTTTQAGMEVNTVNGYTGKTIGKRSISYKRHNAVELYPHMLPDAPNHTGWGRSPFYGKGDIFTQRTSYQFSVAD